MSGLQHIIYAGSGEISGADYPQSITIHSVQEVMDLGLKPENCESVLFHTRRRVNFIYIVLFTSFILTKQLYMKFIDYEQKISSYKSKNKEGEKVTLF